ncbi:MAG TPA: hypothetical protein VGP21_04390 [Opitutaceae bacterium]|nr:hypothetical protein [Opitutaceae bacterium]
MNPWKIGLVFFVCLAVRLSALTQFTSDELNAPPSAARLAEIERVAATSGWKGLVPGLRALAIHAYEHDSQAAEDWLFLSRWAELFATPEDQVFSQWVDAIQAAKVGHSNLPTRFDVRKRPLGDRLSPALQAWILGRTDFSAEFFSLVSPCDLLTYSFEILNELYASNPQKFSTYANLALAIAVVYDLPPPPDWPHAQVSAAQLPRTLPGPVAAFAFWVHADETGQTLQPLSRLPASELKFVVDAVAPLGELNWAQHAVHIVTPVNWLASIYSMVHYRTDRVQQAQYSWPEDHYDLQTILAKGGICVDQAYFACEVGKAKGVPTLLFSGAGSDAWHAWIGYLDQNGHWQLDVGRYADQQFVTGVATDPQTWGPITDHELKFLSEGFRLRPSWRQACVNADFATLYLAAGDFAAAARAARSAVNYEPRHLAAWQTLLEAQKHLGSSPTDIESTLREFALAFKNYPDIEAPLVHAIAESMRARGETSAADMEDSQFAHKVAPERVDLNIEHAADLINHSMATDSTEAQIRTYYSVLKTYGHGAGMEFFSRIVQPFAQHLKAIGLPREALSTAMAAQQALKIDPNSELDEQMQELLTELKAGNQN